MDNYSSDVSIEDQDKAHLNSLALAHKVIGIIMVIMACLPLLHMSIGLSIVMGAEFVDGDTASKPPAIFGWFFFIIGAICFTLGQAIAVSIIISGQFIKKRKCYLFSFIMACIVCVFFPVGTVLGVFSIVILSRESVRLLYASGKHDQTA